jgi:hypothetical protein
MTSPKSKLFAVVSDQGTAMPETVLTEPEYNDPKARSTAEDIARMADDCSNPIEWEDVTENEACWITDQ